MNSNELICTVCFNEKCRFVRQCKCFYCMKCRETSSDRCLCGGSGAFLDLAQSVPEEVKNLTLDPASLLKKSMEKIAGQVMKTIQRGFTEVHSALEFKNHYQKRIYQNMQNQLESLKSENSSLKSQLESLKSSSFSFSKRRDAFPFETPVHISSIAESDSLRYSTPRNPLRPLMPNASTKSFKKPFEHEGFTSFFKK